MPEEGRRRVGGGSEEGRRSVGEECGSQWPHQKKREEEAIYREASVIWERDETHKADLDFVELFEELEGNHDDDGLLVRRRGAHLHFLCASDVPIEARGTNRVKTRVS